MDNNTLQLFDEDEDMVTGALNVYRELREAGKTKSVAKATVYTCYPGMAETIKEFSSAEFSRWGRGIQEIERALRGNGHQLSGEFTAPDSPVESAAEFSRWMFAKWRERAQPQAGSTFVFSPHQWADIYERLTGNRVYPGAFVNEFLSSQKYSQLQKLGYKFDTTGDYECYKVMIIETPALPRTYTAEEVDKIAAEAAAEAVRRFMASAMDKLLQ